MLLRVACCLGWYHLRPWIAVRVRVRACVRCVHYSPEYYFEDVADSDAPKTFALLFMTVGSGTE